MDEDYVANIFNLCETLFCLIKLFSFVVFLYLFIRFDILNKILRTNLYYEMIQIEEYLRICNKTNLMNKRVFKKIEKPKISIITPVYNKENSILRYLRSIQNQLFDSIEIIIIDDKSIDNSRKIIEEVKEEDKRIILIKNLKRKGTLINKNIGAFISNGEYLLFVDPDDLLSEDILNYLNNLLKEKNYDLIRFHLYTGDKSLNLPYISNYLKRSIIYKPDIYFSLFYGFGQLFQLDFYITNKLIKRNLFISALNSINDYYLKQFMIDCEDGLINFMLYRLSQSLSITKKIGYYYIVTNQSITNDSDNFKIRLRSNFLYFKYLFENTKNNNIEKKMADFVLNDVFKRYSDVIINLFKFFPEDHNFYLNIINQYLDNEFISFKTKLILTEMRNSIKSKK